MRCILLVLDGLGDKGHTCFEGRTPLKVAFTPNLDHLASLGMNGLYHSYYQGTAMPSELAHFLMFGYEINEFPGRGLIEAVGEGITVNDGEVSLLARIFSVNLKDDMLMLEKENPTLDRNSCRILQEEIRTFQKDGIEIEFVPTRGIEGMLILRGNVSAYITDSNPIYEGRPLMEVTPFEGKEEEKGAVQTARVLNSYLKWCYHTLSGHPVNRERCKEGLFPINAVGTQRAGMRRDIIPFREKWGLRGLSIAAGSIYHGLCSLLKIKIRKVQETGNLEEDLLERLKMAKEAVDFDFIHVHTKAPDKAAHTKNPEHKKAVIESLDHALSYAIDEIIADDDVLFIITSDHSTASAGSMIHSGETVPLTMVGKYTRRDDVGEFNEISCAKGGLGLVKGKELMYLILNFLDRGKLWGLMDSPVNQPFSPGNYKPLRIE
jgi:2,3-bisphosphoglycerate-independent phosphoglycerate mutase